MKSTPDLCDAYEGGISVLEPCSLTLVVVNVSMAQLSQSNVSKTTPK